MKLMNSQLLFRHLLKDLLQNSPESPRVDLTLVTYNVMEPWDLSEPTRETCPRADWRYRHRSALCCASIRSSMSELRIAGQVNAMSIPCVADPRHIRLFDFIGQNRSVLIIHATQAMEAIGPRSGGRMDPLKSMQTVGNRLPVSQWNQRDDWVSEYRSDQCTGH
jgi:hypothetical protein